MKLSIRNRLTFAFTLVFAALLVLFTSVVYFFLKSGLDQKLREDSLHDMGVLVTNLTKPDWKDEVNEMPDESDEFRLLIRVYDANGELLITGGKISVSDWPVDKQYLLSALANPKWDQLELRDVPYQVLTQSFTPPGEKPHFIQIANSLADNEWILNQLVYYINVGSFVVLIAAVMAGHYFSKKALDPVAKIQARAEMINSDRLDERLSYDGPPDELYRLTNTLNDMLSRIQRSINQMKGFIADASHELRVPLAGIRGTLEVGLRQKRSPDEYHEIMETAHRESERLSELVIDLLSLARADAGELKIEKTDVEMKPFFEDIFDEARILNSQGDVNFRLGPVPNGKARFDAAKVHQVLINLIENAIRYNKPGGDVVLSAKIDAEKLVISVRDTGLGIREEDQGKIFDRFFRVDKTRSRDAGGTGLGLAISRSIAEAHKGTLSVRSVFSVGSEFTFTLPLS